MKFEYEAFDRRGIRFRKTIRAETWDEAASKIRARGFLPLSVSGISRGEEDARKRHSAFRRILPRYPFPRHRDVLYLTRRLATLLGSGISVGRSLEILKNQFYGMPMEKVVSDVREALDRGRSLADSFGEHPKIFGEFFRAVVHAGEFGGDLDGSLRRMADQLELARARKRKLTTSLIYPTIVVILTFTIVTVIGTFIIPFFRKVYESSGMTQLPRLTEILLSINQMFLNNWYWLAGTVVATVVGVIAARKTPRGRYSTDYAILRIPIMGGMIRRHNLAWFHRTLGAMQESGVGLIEGLEVVRRVVHNHVPPSPT
jgi:type II secretory pathway component PulF